MKIANIIASSVLIQNTPLKPNWKNSLNQKINSITFNFQGFTKTSPYENVDSNSVFIKINEILSYPATIHLLRPRDCKIGNNTIEDQDIAIMIDDKVFTLNTTINFTNNTEYLLKQRFLARGGYAQKYGNVNCQYNGEFRYIY